MAYTQPTTFVNGTAITSTGQRANDDDARFFVNQNIRSADLADQAFDYDSIQRGELCPINNHHTFPTGEVYGDYNDNSPENRSYFTSLVKANDQINSVQFQDIHGTGDMFTLTQTAYIFYTVGLQTYCAEREGPGDSPNAGMHASAVMLRLTDEADGIDLYLAASKSYAFEESSASAVDKEPGDTVVNARRWIGFQYMVQLNAGTYSIACAINPRVEVGYSAHRSFTLEIFYI